MKSGKFQRRKIRGRNDEQTNDDDYDDVEEKKDNKEK